MREYLDILEDLILQENRKKVFAIFFLAILFLIISTMSYFFIHPKIEEISKKQEDLRALEKKILKNSTDTIQSKIVLRKKEILKNQSKKENLKLQILALQSKLENINSFIDSMNFSTFLDYLLKNSIKQSVLLNNIKIEDKQKPFVDKLYIKKSLSVNGSGRFLNIIKFARALESKKMLFNLEKFNIETNGSMPNFSFEINFYGVKD